MVNIIINNTFDMSHHDNVIIVIFMILMIYIYDVVNDDSDDGDYGIIMMLTKFVLIENSC